MTCPGCDREGVALIGGFCGTCSTKMSRAVREALEDTDILPDPTVYDVTKWDDGYIHFRVEAGDINPGVGAGGDP